MVVRETASGGFNSVISVRGGDNRLNSDTSLRLVSEFKRLSPPLAEITELNPPEADSLTTIRIKFLF